MWGRRPGRPGGCSFATARTVGWLSAGSFLRQVLLARDVEGHFVDIVVKGRNTEVGERFRTHVADKLAKIEKLDPKVISIDVECSQERNPRMADQRERIELTIYSRGPVVRAEASAQDSYAALDAAVTKLEGRLRRAHDRRVVHHGAKTPVSVATATARLEMQNGISAGLPGAAAEDDRGSDQGASPDDGP